MNPDCTGKIRYTVNLTGISATIEERFFVFDEGREIRSVPILLGRVAAQVDEREHHQFGSPHWGFC